MFTLCQQRPVVVCAREPDSANIPVDVATVTVVGTVGDSIWLHLTTDSAVAGALPPDEVITVAAGPLTNTFPLNSLTVRQVVLHLSSSDTTTIRYTLNRRLGSVPPGPIALTQGTSAQVVSAVTPWVEGGSAGLQSTATANAVDPCSGPQPVNAPGTYCGVAVQFSRYAPADAFLAAGARFQSNVGHGISQPITITFSNPVSSVTVTAYDPTFNGNKMEAFDASGASLGVAPFPGNGIPGVLTIQTRTLSGSTSRVLLTPAPLDYVNYSMMVTFANTAAVSILSAGGPNPGGSFTTGTTENLISLRADATPASLLPSIVWEVVDDPADEVPSIAPGSLANGANISFSVPLANRARSRWPQTHTASYGDSLRKALSFRVTASATSQGTVVRSQAVTVRQDEIDTMREEYREFGQASVLARGEIGRSGDANRNSGDYTVWAASPLLLQRMPIMQSLAVGAFERPITVTSGFRNPVHHFLHIGAVAVNSVHLTGGATDWRITDAPPALQLTKEQYFDRVKALTHDPRVGGCWEPKETIIRYSPTHTLDHGHTHWSATGCEPNW